MKDTSDFVHSVLSVVSSKTLQKTKEKTLEFLEDSDSECEHAQLSEYF